MYLWGIPPPNPQKIIDRLTPVFDTQTAFEHNSNAVCFRFVASLPFYASSSNAFSASYASTLGAISILPRKARREPKLACAYEAS